MLYVLQLLQLRVLWKVWKPWADNIERTIRDAVRQTRRMLQHRSHPIDLPNAKEFGDVVVGIVFQLVCAYADWDGTEGSSGSHSPLNVAIWAYLDRVLTFVFTWCYAAMEIRPPDVE